MPFPNVKEAMNGWDQELKFDVIVKTVVDFQQTEKTMREVTFRGIMEPIPTRRLLVKPEGQRKWKWWTLWVRGELPFSLGTMIRDSSGTLFRVMESTDYQQGGFTRHELVENPE